MAGSSSNDIYPPQSKRRTTAISHVVTQHGRCVAVDVDVHFGRRLRRRRRLLGLTQGQLAQACGTGFQQIQKYECGATRMSAGRLWQVAGLLGVDLSYFFQGLPDLQRIDFLRDIPQVDAPGEMRSFTAG